MLKPLRVFHRDAGEDFGRPIHGFFAGLFMLRQPRVGPFAIFGSFFVLEGARVDRSAGLADIDGFFVAAALKAVDAFASARRRPAFILAAEDVLEFHATFVEEVAVCFFESALELVGNSRYET